MEEGQHYSSCLLGMVYGKKPCTCEYISMLLSGRSTKETYIAEFAGDDEE
jgi:hypothetical protein